MPCSSPREDVPRCVGATGSPAPAPSGELTDARARRCPRRGQGANSTSRIGTPPQSLAMGLFERGAELPALSHPPGIAAVAPGTREVGPRAREVVPGARAFVPVGRALVPAGRALVPVSQALVPVARGAGSLARGAGSLARGAGSLARGAGPRESGAAPRESGAAPRASETAPRASGAAPRASETAPRASETAPRVAAVVSRTISPSFRDRGPRTGVGNGARRAPTDGSRAHARTPRRASEVPGPLPKAPGGSAGRWRLPGATPTEDVAESGPP
jgi:hypothetical protein